jgi:hypothetical protein
LGAYLNKDLSLLVNDPKVRQLTTRLFKDYASNGKEEYEHVIKQVFPGSYYTIVQPTFIHGGDEFQLNPPRLLPPSNIAGSLAEDLFGLYPFQYPIVQEKGIN